MIKLLKTIFFLPYYLYPLAYSLYDKDGDYNYGVEGVLIVEWGAILESILVFMMAMVIAQ